MKPCTELASTTTPDGKRMVLSRHDRDFFISVDGRQLMTSREHESELELARLGCEKIRKRPRPVVLIGGLGMGYTLRQTLDLLPPGARVVVAELMPDVVRWNQELLGELAGHPLRDGRVTVESCDVAQVIRRSESAFDAILLDVDNGPGAMTYAGNDGLYGPMGIGAAMRALRPGGCLAIWSVDVDPRFEGRLRREGLKVRHFRVRAYAQAKNRSRCVWAVAQDARALPEGETPDKAQDGPTPSRRR
ncbi:MAG: hypothetical protein RBS72_15255 [Sedimentisphaerales bacterium]|nr:hypothetical protein [Sedimentisphaerales bacterium]HNY79782.1 hypothetical protein [Sedimentisphaerales bacterium]HOC62240.1 hypothetical protein [Sedimentisphaerales bacterium]HOH63119.1 hypothetical protein [Sedimentisphaerales bacterium]HQA91094.1 hypothetical protein [Sedimentisphaerales bacterium]